MRNRVEVSTIKRSMLIPVILPPVVLVLAATIGMLVIALGGCGRREPIRIGFAEQLTGTRSSIGIQTRSGAEMAVQEINESGGVNGRPIELIIRDDKGTAEGARAADRILINSGVVAIIGHATSQQTKEALPTTNAARVVLISPTASADDLTTKGGYFFRVVNGNRTYVSGFARSIYKRHGPLRIAIVYDSDNAAYAKSYRELFTSQYESLGGKVISEVAFSSKAKLNFDPLLRKLLAAKPEGLLIIASTYDTALIAQRLRIMGSKILLFSSSAAQVLPLIRLGGRAVKGLETVENYDLNSQSPAFLDVKARYQRTYGEDPTPIALLGYETVEVLAAALKKTDGKREGLREALLETKDFKGLVDTFSFDNRGGAVRLSYVVIIRDGKAVVVDTIKPQEGK
jgi:branched-chain amino acid transport system substrate-binding protein